ncbi:MAG: hypothetical protein HUU13_07550 [Burkholderiaceae bacterium]|nr:hypothetical protein [Burkholderiaceae bacterium]
MSLIRYGLTCATSIAALAFGPAALAQTAYAYSVALTVASPTGSSAAAAAKVKTLPLGLKFSPCEATTLDQFAFTIKFDAGKLGTTTPATPETRQNAYLIFHKDGTAYFPLVRQPLTNSSNAFFKAYTSPADIAKTDAYTAAANNLGGLQTEVILGGNLTVQGLDSGVWLITAIIAPEDTVNFNDPSTWSAWDTTAFMLRKPWRGPTASICQ